MTGSTNITRAMLSRTASVAAIALMLGAAPAFAQTPAAEENAGEIVVTGIRASLDASAQLKRRTPTIVESISAEDIGKLPDVSIADSLARLPGVTAQRLEGRDQRLSIRGLGPDFSTTLLNGREQVTVGDNRGVEYDQYPSEFFQNVVVHKSADPSLIAAGIAGTVDLRMLRPLSQKRTISVRARGQMNGTKNLNPDSTRYGYRASQPMSTNSPMTRSASPSAYRRRQRRRRTSGTMPGDFPMTPMPAPLLEPRGGWVVQSPMSSRTC